MRTATGAALFMLALLATSCQKQSTYTCKCTITSPTGDVNNYEGTSELKYEAETWCEDKEDQADYNGDTADCEVK